MRPLEAEEGTQVQSTTRRSRQQSPPAGDYECQPAKSRFMSVSPAPAEPFRGNAPDRRRASRATGSRSRRARCWAGSGATPKRGPGEFDLAGHAGCDRQHPIGAGEIAALPGRLARQRNRFLIVPSDELGIGGNAVIDRGRGIARALADGALRRRIGILHRPL